MNNAELISKLTIIKNLRHDAYAKYKESTVLFAYMDLVTAAENVYHTLEGMQLLNLVYKNGADQAHVNLANTMIDTMVSKFNDIIEQCLALLKES